MIRPDLAFGQWPENPPQKSSAESSWPGLEQADPSLARHDRSLPRLGLRGHAPADDGRGGPGAVRSVPGEIPGPFVARPRPRGERARGLVGTRLLRPGPQPPPRGRADRAGPRRSFSPRSPGALPAPRLRRLHRRGRGLPRFRLAPSRRGRQRHAGPLPIVRHRRNSRAEETPRGRSPPRRAAAFVRAARPADRHADGSGPAHLHAAAAPLRVLPARRKLPGAAKRVARALSAAHPKAAGCPRVRRGGLRAARRAGAPRPPARDPPRRPLGVPIGRRTEPAPPPAAASAKAR